ncbi:MAG: hypothetical protein WC360_01345, partial [Opitutales bacterium]
MKVKVHPYNSPSKPKLKYIVAVNAPEGRTRKYFETKKAADAYAQVKRLEGEEMGNRAVEIDADIRLAALKASKALKPYGRS